MIKYLNPWQYLIISFVLIIAFGTFLLNMPFVSHTEGMSFVDTIFISTSAVCVTGLSTVSTSGFNKVGQLVILGLIQIGAIGIMTLTSSFILFLRGSIGLKHKKSFMHLEEVFHFENLSSILSYILKVTFISELVGAILLFIGFMIQGNSVGSSIYNGIFHSVSAFCNAGFSTYDSSLMGMNPFITYTVMGLIIMGGLGFFVVYDIINKYKSRKTYSLHTKIILLSNVVLIFGGAILLYLFQNGDLSINDSLFQSVTTRTAGFNTVDLGGLHYINRFLMIGLMFIGASPGSTGGGVKTTIGFIVFYSVFRVLQGKTNIVIFNRNIPSTVIIKSFAVVVIYFLVAFTATLLLLYNTDYNFLDTLFEVVSALGTVGLSSGITGIVGDYGKIILIVLMFIGRIGPASLAMATFSEKKDIDIKYPDGTIY